MMDAIETYKQKNIERNLKAVFKKPDHDKQQQTTQGGKS